jgi:hypothetical protein
MGNFHTPLNYRHFFQKTLFFGKISLEMENHTAKNDFCVKISNLKFHRKLWFEKLCFLQKIFFTICKKVISLKFSHFFKIYTLLHEFWKKISRFFGFHKFKYDVLKFPLANLKSEKTIHYYNRKI